MNQYQFIGQHELEAFNDVLARHGWKPGDFELQEDAFDPATAEVEAALGEVAVRCLKTQAVAAYRVGAGSDWVKEFEDDLQEGKMGDPTRASS